MEAEVLQEQFHVGDVVQFRKFGIHKKTEVKYDESDVWE